MKKIMIVEDDKNICNELKILLNNSNYDTAIIKDFKNAKDEILNENPDLILLDINIPYLNGEDLLLELRKDTNIPIIMVTSKNSEVDEVLSMSYGADDYITKPYNPTILLLHINAIFKRLDKGISNIKYDDLIFIPQKGILKNNNSEVILTKNEMLIFSYLLQNRGKIITRDELMNELWNNDEYINDNALTVNISRLRNKLKSLGYVDRLETRKKQGYILL